MIELDIECAPASASEDLTRVNRLCHALENRDELMAQVRKHLHLRAPEPPKVKLPDLNDRFNHTRNVEKSTVKYFTNGRYVPAGCERDVVKEINPFSRPVDTNILKKVFLHTENRNQPAESCFLQKHCLTPCICKNQSVHDTKKCSLHSKGPLIKETAKETAKEILGLRKSSRGSSNVRKSFSKESIGSRSMKSPVRSTSQMRSPSQAEDNKSKVLDEFLMDKNCPQVNPICARLYVPDVPLPISKTDLDPDYFNVAKGRPVREVFNKHEFSRVQKTVIFKKLFAGFLNDEVKKRKEHLRLDMWDLGNISRELDKVKETQELFANESHTESVNIVTEQMTVSKMREKRENELIRCKGYVNVIKSSLYKKDDSLSTSMYCRDILLQLSPTKFRTEYEEEVQKYRGETMQLVKKVVGIFTDYCRYNPDPDPDLFLNEVVHTFVKQLLSLGPPRIYFKNKWEIEMVFRKMELQCMEQMDDLQRMRRIEMEIEDVSRDMKQYYARQKGLVSQEIEAFQANSEYQTRRSIELEAETNHVINTSFKDIVSGDILDETLGLVQVLYDYVFGPSNTKFEGPEMMIQIEQELRSVDLQIQEMGHAHYKYYERKVNKKMKKEMEDALEAKAKDRKLRETIRRVCNLYTKPPYGRGPRRAVPRSHPFFRKDMLSRKEKPKKLVEKKPLRHLQLEGICDRDDVEADIDTFLNKFTARRRRVSASDDGLVSSITKRSSLHSAVTSISMEKAIEPVFQRVDEDELSQKTLSIVQLDYDSDEELLRKNFEKKKRRGEEVSEPEVLYEIRSIDSKFMVTSKREKPALKDRRHEHRPEPKTNQHPLSWR